MHSIPGVIAVAIIAFVGTMFDDFFAFAAQLLATERSRYRRVEWAHAVAMTVIVLLAAVLGSLLSSIPLRWVGVLALAPWGLGLHAWRQRAGQPRGQFRRGAITTFTLTLALGGDNIAVWTPLLRANDVAHAAVTVAVFALAEVAFILGAQAVTGRPRFVNWGTRHAPAFIPWVYLSLGVLILAVCHTI